MRLRNLQIVLVAAFMLVSTSFASEVTNVELSYKAGYTAARIDIDGPVRFTHQTEVAKDGKPFRVIIDILSATHELGAKSFTRLPNCAVTSLRTSQFSVNPEKIVRLVFDMNKESVYKIDSDSKSVQVLFPDKNSSFSNWSTYSVVSAMKAAKMTPAPKVATTTTPIKATTESKPVAKKATVAQLNKNIESDRMASLEGSSPAAKQTTPVIQKPVVKSKPAVTKPASTPKVEAPEKEKKTFVLTDNYSLPKASATPPPVVAKSTPKKSTPPPVVAKSTPKKSTPPPVVAKSTPKKSTPPPVVAKSTPKKSTPPPVVAKSTPKKYTPPPVVAKSTPKKSTPPPVVAKSTPKKSTPPPVVAKSTPKKSTPPPVVAKSTPKKTKPSPAVAKSTPKKSKAKVVAKADPKSDKKATSRFRRSAAQDRKIKGTMVAEFPKRLVVKYRSHNRRDPFATLVDETKTTTDVSINKKPNVEGLKLVGVIEADNGKNRALFEDKTGYGYILKSGDKVQKGYVLRVEKNRVYFQLFEYGWSRTVALKLDEN